MLELRNITKDYKTSGECVHALKGISLQFRKSEFVSILGQSGCGKTTMLNIIGGLDQYSDGDLLINGKSTKNFKDRDWDTYRNHSIGFVFQSYNLIPHQSVLQNVELALTLSGVSKKKRHQRAIEALEAVGLKDQINKKPSEMSGGQMQRVAIARAIVNDPDIILADEPTGALDSETSIQVMEILKKIAEKRLVIMVTHNPDLANQYSTRIIRMLDGVVIDDSMPYHEEIMPQEDKKVKKPSMSLFTSFSLSLKNLWTKKGRTSLTSFAGSIGIIGIALIFAISQGLSSYIYEVQESTLSSYPLAIEKKVIDLGTVMETFMKQDSENEKHEDDYVYPKSSLYEMIDALNSAEESENDLKSFKAYVDEKIKNDEEIKQAINGVQYAYDFDLLIYTKNSDGEIIYSDTEELLNELILKYMNVDMEAMMKSTSNSMMSMMASTRSKSMALWEELLPGKNGELINDLVKKQYDVVYGRWPQDYNEVVLVLDENNELDDMTLYSLGLESRETIDNIMDASLNQQELDKNNHKWSYEEICNQEYRSVLNADCYRYDEANGYYSDLRLSDAGLKYVYDHGIPLKVCGIIKQSEKSEVGMINGSIAYTYKLTNYVVEHTNNQEVVNKQVDSKDIDIFNGLPFKENSNVLSDAEKKQEFKDYVEGMDDRRKVETFVEMQAIPTQKQIDEAIQQATANQSRKDQQKVLLEGLKSQMSVSDQELESYLNDMSDDEFKEVYESLIKEQFKASYAMQVKQQLANIPANQLLMQLQQSLDNYSDEQFGVFYDEIMEFSDSSYEDNLRALGYVSLDDPSQVNLFATTFESKDVIEQMISDYNKGLDDIQKISYTDYIGIMMSSITQVINAITYILIAFVAISLIVSSIMIGVITLISVQERTKEIGILRAIGASKKDVSSMFNAETIIIGFTSGLLGVIVTYLLCIPINLIIHEATGIMNVNAYLPIPVAIILILISMLLTLISGVIPSRSAAKKDPVVALRSE